jgi:hypothetical protein
MTVAELANSMSGLTLGRDGQVVDGRLELDQGVRLVVEGSRQGLTVLTKVRVVANDTLVAHASNVGLL